MIDVSRREKEVLDLIAEELTTRQIAEKLCISEKTVEGHRDNLLAKCSGKEYGWIDSKSHMLWLHRWHKILNCPDLA